MLMLLEIRIEDLTAKWQFGIEVQKKAQFTDMSPEPLL